MITFGSLFTGVGGFDLGFEQAGMVCKWQVENDPYCIRVLERHWPSVQRYDDICTTKHPNYVDVICGGFPCQDISNAGKRIGIEGKRSGLWAEMFRLVCEVRPRIIVVENVAALLGRGIGRVLGDMAEGGYDAEWDVLPACAFGAPHIRERVFIIGLDSNAKGNRFYSKQEMGGDGKNLAPTNSAGISEGGWWKSEPCMGRMDNGVPNRVDRIRCLGNAVVPPVAKWIGERIVKVLTHD